MPLQAIHVYFAWGACLVDAVMFTGKLHATHVHCVWDFFIDVKSPVFPGKVSPASSQCWHDSVTLGSMKRNFVIRTGRWSTGRHGSFSATK